VLGRRRLWSLGAGSAFGVTELTGVSHRETPA
jgi:hypothetical protein